MDELASLSLWLGLSFKYLLPTSSTLLRVALNLGSGLIKNVIGHVMNNPVFKQAVPLLLTQQPLLFTYSSTTKNMLADDT